MPKYHIGLRRYCPFDNVVVAGTNFPRLSGAPGKEQSEGLMIELNMAQVSEIKNEIDQREVRFFVDGRCSSVRKDENRALQTPEQKRKGERGSVVRGPAVRKCVPLDKLLFMVRETEKVVDAPDPTPVAPDGGEHGELPDGDAPDGGEPAPLPEGDAPHDINPPEVTSDAGA